MYVFKFSPFMILVTPDSISLLDSMYFDTIFSATAKRSGLREKVPWKVQAMPEFVSVYNRSSFPFNAVPGLLQQRNQRLSPRLGFGE